ncbi:PP2C family protein-serine/threonine phosphatase [Bailinhaonella thermotolerans]|uniref:Serine/threonine protein phosphatase PstP n=1 Tax=Bailinhaonella thermotolerans TaxID=1070861 RepID=A0A3A4AWG4_9ACTN|nr:PP2C family serine/threonine-protein phosphatase [Bailinhaonella thermotolerans]RJL31694.1 serine/threonine-protein phosphatase [Bailinhaonella thermotolerans]
MTDNGLLELRYAVGSDTGLRRELNEDSAYASPRLLAVADGMGGHAAGEVASSVAVAALSDLDDGLPEDLGGVDLIAALSAGVADASHRLKDLAERNPSLEGMGTTLTAVLWHDGRMALAHVGDSRGYLLRDGKLYQITRDHTLVQSLVDDGRMDPERAAEHPRRSMLMRALQSTGSAEPDLVMRTVVPGDRYLLCSDGLSGVVQPETLHEILTDVDDREEAVRRLIELANQGGGPDNITCVVIDVVEVTRPAPHTGEKSLAGAAANPR